MFVARSFGVLALLTIGVAVGQFLEPASGPKPATDIANTDRRVGQCIGVTGDIHVDGELRASSIATDGALSVGANTLFFLNNVNYPPEPFLSDLVLSGIQSAQTGRISFAHRQVDDFSGIDVGIGLGDPQHKLHLHNGPLTPFGFTPRDVTIALTNDATGKAPDDGLHVGIDIAGTATIVQQEDLPLHLGTSGTSRVTIANTGEVGIGTTMPQAALHVSGTPGVDGVMFPDGTLQTTAATTPAPVRPTYLNAPFLLGSVADPDCNGIPNGFVGVYDLSPTGSNVIPADATGVFVRCSYSSGCLTGQIHVENVSASGANFVPGYVLVTDVAPGAWDTVFLPVTNDGKLSVHVIAVGTGTMSAEVVGYM